MWTVIVFSFGYMVLLAMSIPLLRDARLLQTVGVGDGVDLDGLRRVVDQEPAVASWRW